MTDEMYNHHTSYLAQALQQDQPNSGNQMRSSFYPHNSASLGHNGVLENNFPHQSSVVTPIILNNHTTEIENHGVSALSLLEPSRNYRVPRRNFEENHVDSSQHILNDARLNDNNGSDSYEHSFNDTRRNEVDRYDLEALTNEVRRKLIASGQLDGLKELAEKRLSEVGWRLDMVALCRDFVRKHGTSITFDQLYKELESSAKDEKKVPVPQEIKDELIGKIKNAYERVCNYEESD